MTRPPVTCDHCGSESVKVSVARVLPRNRLRLIYTCQECNTAWTSTETPEGAHS